MAVTRSLVLLIVAILCFAVSLLLATGILGGGNETAWLAGGLLAFAAAHLP